MELLKEIAPNARRVAVLSDAFTVDQLRTAERAAHAVGLAVQAIEFGALPYDYASAFAAMAKERAGAAMITVGPVFFRDRARLLEIAAQQRLPTMFPLPELADAGGLIAYGASLNATFASAAPYLEKILKGVKPADLPIEGAREFELVVNLKTARAMGVTIPPSILVRASRVIE
jgi:putative ABC transport system substrate-binding protein